MKIPGVDLAEELVKKPSTQRRVISSVVEKEEIVVVHGSKRTTIHKAFGDRTSQVEWRRADYNRNDRRRGVMVTSRATLHGDRVRWIIEQCSQCQRPNKIDWPKRF